VSRSTKHLGGWNEDDPLTFYPRLWTWLIDRFEVRRMLDVGAGDGRAVRFFAERGVDAVGVDGLGGDGIVRHDFRRGPAPLAGRFDLCWSCEFVEHVERRHVGNYLAAFDLCGTVAMSHAIPGQIGHHHVNCQPLAYWERLLADRGFVLRERLTLEARELAARDALDQEQPAPGYFARAGLIFCS